MKIKWVELGKVTPYERNPRTRDHNAVDAVKESLRVFGWQQPIVVDADMVIIAGHTRFLAAQALKDEGSVAAGRQDAQKVPVRIADELTPDEVKAYRIADNRTNENAKWDEALLKLELEDVSLSYVGESAKAWKKNGLKPNLAADDTEEGQAAKQAAQAILFTPLLHLTGLDQAELIRTLELDKTILPPAEPPAPGGRKSKQPQSDLNSSLIFQPADMIEFGTHALNVGHDHPELPSRLVTWIRKEFPKLEILVNGEPLA